MHLPHLLDDFKLNSVLKNYHVVSIYNAIDSSMKISILDLF